MSALCGLMAEEVAVAEGLSIYPPFDPLAIAWRMADAADPAARRMAGSAPIAVVPHVGFGLGVERTVTWITDIHHLREATAFPRMLEKMYP